MYLAWTIADYLSRCSADSPTPGGGSVSALAAALGITMGEMAANFTVKREKFKDVEPQVKEVLAALERTQEKVVRSIDEDSVAYEKLSGAYKLPRGTDEEKAARKSRIQEALKGAMAVPVEVVRSCVAVLVELDRLVELANPNLISDVGVSAVLAEAALRGAKLNVEINLAYLEDPDLVATTRQEVEDNARQAKELADSVLARVEKRMGKD